VQGATWEARLIISGHRLGHISSRHLASSSEEEQ
jgi:hypothetical protein